MKTTAFFTTIKNNNVNRSRLIETLKNNGQNNRVCAPFSTVYKVYASHIIQKKKLTNNTSCEIEDLVETHLSLKAGYDTSIARTTSVRVLHGLIQETQSVHKEDRKTNL